MAALFSTVSEKFEYSALPRVLFCSTFPYLAVMLVLRKFFQGLGLNPQRFCGLKGLCFGVANPSLCLAFEKDGCPQVARSSGVTERL